MSKRLLVVIAVLAVVGGVAYLVFATLQSSQLPESIASGNGRIEASMVDIETKLPGRVAEVRVEEGDMVQKNSVVARLDTHELDARYKLAEAQIRQAEQQKKLALAVLRQRQSELSFAQKNLQRSQTLYVNKNISLAQLQQHETALQISQAALDAAQAQIVNADAAIDAAQAQADTVHANLDDSVMYAPIDGRVLYRLHEPGEVVGSGGKIVTLLDLQDVYMTLFLPTSQAGKVAVGSEARIVLDAFANIAIPARVTFVSPQAQFTPKAIETQSEREKLMFRIKVRIDEALLRRHAEKIKVGLPGTAYVRLDDAVAWPEPLNRLPETAPAP